MLSSECKHCAFSSCQQLGCVFPLTHIFPVRSTIKCWSPWQSFWNIIIFNSIHRCLHSRDLKEKGFSMIFCGEIVLSTWHGLGHGSGCFIPPFPWPVIILVGDKPWAVLLPKGEFGFIPLTALLNILKYSCEKKNQGWWWCFRIKNNTESK